VPAANGVLDLSGGAEDSRLKIILDANGGQISGHVQDNNGPPAPLLAFVMLVPDPWEVREDLRYSDLSSDGAYKFSGLPPGHYQLLPVSRLDNVNDVEDVITSHKNMGEIIEIKEGDRVSKDLKLTADEEAHGPPK